MIDPSRNADFRDRTRLSRRQLIQGAASLGALVTLPQTARSETPMQPHAQPKAFVYTEVALSIPFAEVPWKEISDTIRAQPGFLNKTWLSGHANDSLGGFYAFDSLDNARAFVTGYFPSETRDFGVAQTTRLFDAETTRAASLDIGSPHYGAALPAKPGAFVYTEVQVDVPFDHAPWTDRNPALKAQQGLLTKTWLSGVNTHTLGGFDAFDTLDNALDFALNTFPETAARMNAAFTTRVFDASLTEEASRYLGSPFYG
ncbi:YdhR family protein [Seohaeicola saemankumensis]|nr:YdhR family protein [Seohaeicola saemankumensis]MCA0873122.1 YdhR family protein [Seohaeicola saemankumensis]